MAQTVHVTTLRKHACLIFIIFHFTFFWTENHVISLLRTGFETKVLVISYIDESQPDFVFREHADSVYKGFYRMVEGGKGVYVVGWVR